MGNLGIDERIILKCILKENCVDRIQWWTSVNMLMNLLVS